MGILIKCKSTKGVHYQVKANHVVDKGDHLKAYSGKCDCYKNTCNCVTERIVYKNHVIEMLEI